MDERRHRFHLENPWRRGPGKDVPPSQVFDFSFVHKVVK